MTLRGRPDWHCYRCTPDSLPAKHYDYMPMQYIEIFKIVKNEYFQY